MSRFRANRTKSSSFPLSRIASEFHSFARTERAPGGRGDCDSFFSHLTESASGERERENPSVSSRSADRGSMKAERARAREHKEVCKRKRKNRNLWTRLSERCPPSWSRLTTGVDQRNFAITLLPSSFLPIYLSIYLSRSLSLFFSLAFFLPPLFPLLVRLILDLPSLIRLTLSSHTVITIVFFLFIYI